MNCKSVSTELQVGFHLSKLFITYGFLSLMHIRISYLKLQASISTTVASNWSFFIRKSELNFYFFTLQNDSVGSIFIHIFSSLFWVYLPHTHTHTHTHTYIYIYICLQYPRRTQVPCFKKWHPRPCPLPVPVPVPTFPSNLGEYHRWQNTMGS